VDSKFFPMRFYREDQQLGINKISGNDTFNRTCCEGLIQLMMTGVARLSLTTGDVSNAIQCGVGFCDILVDYQSVISSITLKELAILDCLQRLIPFRNIIGGIIKSLSFAPKPQMVGYILEYLVAFGLVAKLNPDYLYETKPSKHSFPKYIQSTEPNEIYFPNHCCGPDIVYKHDGILYLVQIEFVNIISKQERMKACHTTDPNYFYWNCKDQKVLKGFKEERNAILGLLHGIKYKRMVFLHLETKTMAGMEEVEVINQEKCPTFFDAVNTEIWPLLNAMREKFNEK